MAGLQETTKGGRLHIGIFGRRNAGKSSLINALTKQQIALVSDVAGTTTDPVYKAMEMLPIGPIMIIDTAGIDDTGFLGELRVTKTREVYGKTDIAVIVVDAQTGWSDFEAKLVEDFAALQTPVIVAVNKADVLGKTSQIEEETAQKTQLPTVLISTKSGAGLDRLRALITELAPKEDSLPPLIGDLIDKGDLVLCCVPVDSAAPKGRLILPQVQMLRDILDYDGVGVIVKEDRLADQMTRLNPKIVVTDSQVFPLADKATPKEIPLTSFSILMARQKANLPGLVEGAKAVAGLKPGDKILIAEACTHVCQAEDIGRVKIPAWLKKAVGGDLDITYYTGDSFPADVTPYKLVIHCGACMINRKAMLCRQRICEEAGVPMVNYGVLIAHLHGILSRALSPFGL
jgi:[FeFe] hydrogenase H-cluster maturation GTPase HydF